MAAGNREATASFLIGSLAASVPTRSSRRETLQVLRVPRTMYGGCQMMVILISSSLTVIKLSMQGLLDCVGKMTQQASQEHPTV